MDDSVSFFDDDVSDAYSAPPFPDDVRQFVKEHPFSFTPELDPTTAFTAAPLLSVVERVMLVTVTLSVADAED